MAEGAVTNALQSAIPVQNDLPDEIFERCSDLVSRMFAIDEELVQAIRDLARDSADRGISRDKLLTAIPFPARYVFTAILDHKEPPKAHKSRIDKLCAKWEISRADFESHFYGASSIGFFEELTRFANSTSNQFSWSDCWHSLSEAREKRIRGQASDCAQSPLWLPSDVHRAAEAMGANVSFARRYKARAAKAAGSATRSPSPANSTQAQRSSQDRATLSPIRVADSGALAETQAQNGFRDPSVPGGSRNHMHATRSPSLKSAATSLANTPIRGSPDLIATGDETDLEIGRRALPPIPELDSFHDDMDDFMDEPISDDEAVSQTVKSQPESHVTTTSKGKRTIDTRLSFSPSQSMNVKRQRATKPAEPHPPASDTPLASSLIANRRRALHPDEIRPSGFPGLVLPLVSSPTNNPNSEAVLDPTPAASSKWSLAANSESAARLASADGWLDGAAIDMALQFCAVRDDSSLITFSSLLPASDPSHHRRISVRLIRLSQSRRDIEALIPLSVNKNHWVLAYLRFRNKTIDIYDSLASSELHGHAAKSLVQSFFAKFDPCQDFSKWHVTSGSYAFPQQLDGWNCGIFTIAMAFYVATRHSLPSKPFHSTLWRSAILRLLVGHTDRDENEDSGFASTFWPFSIQDDTALTAISLSLPDGDEASSVLQATIQGSAPPSLTTYLAAHQRLAVLTKAAVQASVGRIRNGLRDRRHALGQLRVLATIVDLARNLAESDSPIAAEWFDDDKKLIDEELADCQDVCGKLAKWPTLVGMGQEDLVGRIELRRSQLVEERRMLARDKVETKERSKLTVERLARHVEQATMLGNKSAKRLEKELEDAAKDTDVAYDL
ncbi:hypothetical protein B0T25DRAFT_536540 [Lasiosphaeria hispida]|uniref:Ubiquitin-like protease family profile domain-containing protein n=1 Tax=Lasiosphaeria hispida TaxID=260671 RepID=A0AAJ0MFD8_9PEZI|nr:hypothetical protein B0T25DRAFT_536540 [Lasiosphaeria hispida]